MDPLSVGPQSSGVANNDETSSVYRIKRRNQLVQSAELDALIVHVAATDVRAKQGAWVRRTLELIAMWPARSATELAEMHGYDPLPWKV